MNNSWEEGSVTSTNNSIVPLVVRASSASRICSSKPKFDQDEFDVLEQDFIVTLDKKKIIYESDSIDIYCDTKGIATKAKALKNQMENKVRFEKDPLPDGAKTYLQEVWLGQNVGFQDTSLKSNDPKLLKGHAVEDGGIALVGSHYNIQISKNETRLVKGILTGECDVKYRLDEIGIIRDAKCPEDWKSFRKKGGIEVSYYWQLVAYCYLYDCTKAYLDYILMKTPEFIIQIQVQFWTVEDANKLRDSNNAIDNLTSSQRIKTFKAEGIQENIEFLLSRLHKAEAYYNTLTYDMCMNIES